MPFDVERAVADEDLLIAYGNGDLSAARVLTLRLTPRAVRFAQRALGGDRAEAEDIAQEAMLRLWRIAPEWRRGEAKVTTWIYRVVANLCTDRLRKNRNAVDLATVPELADPMPLPEQALEQGDRARALEAALQQLPARQRQAVALRHLEGLANPEIAAIMEITTEAVESLTARGKRSLAKLLAPKRKELGYDE